MAERPPGSVYGDPGCGEPDQQKVYAPYDHALRSRLIDGDAETSAGGDIDRFQAARLAFT
jgi:hypothetical protein